MLHITQFKPGKIVIFDAFCGKEWLKIKLIKITKKGRGRFKDNFWFLAEVIENHTSCKAGFNAVGEIHSFSNSFISENKTEMLQSAEAYKKVKIEWVKRIALAQAKLKNKVSASK